MHETNYEKALRTAYAIFLAPLVLSLAIIMTSLVVGPFGLLISLPTAIVFIPMAWVILLAIGVPAYWALYDLGIRGVWPLATAGLLAGGVTGSIFPDGQHEPNFGMIAMSAVFGALVSAIAWGLRRPDLDVD